MRSATLVGLAAVGGGSAARPGDRSGGYDAGRDQRGDLRALRPRLPRSARVLALARAGARPLAVREGQRRLRVGRLPLLRGHGRRASSTSRRSSRSSSSSTSSSATSATAPTARARPRARTCARPACRSRACRPGASARPSTCSASPTSASPTRTRSSSRSRSRSTGSSAPAPRRASAPPRTSRPGPPARRGARRRRPVTLRARRATLPHPLLETTPGESVTAGDALAALGRLLRLREPRRLAARRPRQRRPLLPALQRQRRRHEPRLADDRLHLPAVHALVRARDAGVRQGDEADPAEVGRRHRPARPADRPRLLVHAARRVRARLREEPAHPADREGRLGGRRAAARLVAADQAEHALRRTTSGSTASSGARSGTRSPTRRPARSATGSTRRSASTPTASTTR